MFKGFLPVRQTFTLSSTNTNNFTGFTVTAVNSPSLGGTNNIAIHYLNYFYPQNTNLGNTSFQKLYVDNSQSSTKNFFNFSNFNFSGSANVLLFDLTNNKKINTTIAGSMIRAVIPDAQGRKLCVLAAESQTMGVTLRKVNDQTGSFTNFKLQGGNKPYVIIYNKVTKNGALAYQAYRQSLAGGGYNVIAADIDELYEQFCYGINKHPLSITHFARFLYDSLLIKPRYFFLIGKSIACSYFSPSSYENLIPTIGIPSCDNMLTSALTASTATHLIPDIPIGRLSALSNSEVAVYLAKIQQHESSPPAEWKKKVLHFVGGDDVSLNNQLSSYMSFCEQIIKDTLIGGNVLTF